MRILQAFCGFITIQLEVNVNNLRLIYFHGAQHFSAHRSAPLHYGSKHPLGLTFEMISGLPSLAPLYSGMEKSARGCVMASSAGTRTLVRIFGLRSRVRRWML